MTEAPVRRIITGHDVRGRSVIQEDRAVPRTQRIGGPHGPLFFEVWNTQSTPARIDRASGEPQEEGIQLAPPANGTRIRILDIPPDDPSLATLSTEQIQAHFAAVGATDAAAASDPTAGSAPHPFMHKTQTVDYGIVLEGEITLIVDDAETLVKAGDIVIQRGTNHGWANRSKNHCRIAFILIDGQYQLGDQ